MPPDRPTQQSLLESFHLDLAYDSQRLQQHVSLLMTANGLRSDDAAVSLGTGWIQQEVIAGHRRLHLDDINGAIDNLNLRTGEPWHTLSIATVDHDPLAHQATAAVDWVDRMDGDTAWKKVEPAPPATWTDLAADLRALREALGMHRRVLITGYYRQATGFYIGSELRAVLGYHVGLKQHDQLWTSDAATTPNELATDTRTIGNGPGLALVINVAATATQDVLNWMNEHHLPVDRLVALTPTTGIGPNSVTSPEAANSLAVAIRDAARRLATRDGDVHLFLAEPLGLSVLLGHHWNRIATTHVYEHMGHSAYTHAFTIDA